MKRERKEKDNRKITERIKKERKTRKKKGKKPLARSRSWRQGKNLK
jgi:hypothetical protein